LLNGVRSTHLSDCWGVSSRLEEEGNAVRLVRVPIPLLSIGALLTLVAMPAQAGVTAARPAHQSINCAGGAIT